MCEVTSEEKEDEEQLLNIKKNYKQIHVVIMRTQHTDITPVTCQSLG